MRSIVFYYSSTGNTKRVAEKIAQELGADIEEIVDHKNRLGLAGVLRGGYDSSRGRETPIEETKKLPENYDLVVLGTPVWNLGPTPAIRSYLAKNSLSEKKVALFCTYGNAGGKRAISKLKKLILGAIFVGELEISRWTLRHSKETENAISAWCKDLKWALKFGGR
jgi:flavodoxin